MSELFHTLGIEPGVIAVNMAGFLLLVLLLKKFAFRPIGEIMGERQREIEADLEEAERARELALADKHSMEEQLESLDERADEIIAQAESDAEARRREIVQRAEEQSRQIIDEGERSVERAADEAREQLRRETTEIAVEISERALREALDDQRQRSLVDAFISDIERIGNDSRGGGGA